MGNGIYVALSGAMAQSTALDVTANNVANAGTTGYQAERMRFAQVLGKARDAAYVRASAGGTDGSAGVISQTGNPLDLAIQGDGYFAVDTKQGVRYTRAGNFRTDATHRLVAADGSPVRSTDGKPIIIPPDAAAVAISPDGEVSVGTSSIGKIAVARFAPNTLQRSGAALFTATAQPLSGGPAPELIPGALEGANFNVVHGMVDLVRVTRTYEALHKMIETYKDIDDRAARSIAGQG